MVGLLQPLERRREPIHQRHLDGAIGRDLQGERRGAPVPVRDLGPVHRPRRREPVGDRVPTRARLARRRPRPRARNGVGRFRARRSVSFSVNRRVIAPLRWVAGRSVLY